MVVSGIYSLPPLLQTAAKYRKYSSADDRRPLQPGERMSVTREMERNVRGYREVSRGLAEARRSVEHQRRLRSNLSMEKSITTSYYKPVAGTR